MYLERYESSCNFNKGEAQRTEKTVLVIISLSFTCLKLNCISHIAFVKYYTDTVPKRAGSSAMPHREWMAPGRAWQGMAEHCMISCVFSLYCHFDTTSQREDSPNTVIVL